MGWKSNCLDPKAHKRVPSGFDKWMVEASDALISLPAGRAEWVGKMGGEGEIHPLKEIFEKHSATMPLYAPAHGDLHATNVLVRHGEAIIIDSEKMRGNYPLTYDPASLEGGLLVEGLVKDLKRKDIKPEKLVELLERSYKLKALHRRSEVFCPR